ncbi:hypothetical protein RS81_00965 [Microbacterium terrae]|uniref:FG-GAP repeat protein n=1 Tax=Microbacterium terrae TaxID=69369 RepID=A0A0M2H9B7_9MICO|nr:hypothetical protein RS81_00965 [Microbacterium terrae]
MRTSPRLRHFSPRRWLTATLVAVLVAPLAVGVAAPASAASSVSISGQVFDSDGTTAGSVWVAAWRPGARTFIDRVQADAAGRFTIPGLTAGWKYYLSAETSVSSKEGRSFGYFTGDPSDPETGYQARGRIFVTKSAGLSGLTLQREARTSISGAFRNADGSPQADAEVYVYARVDYATAPDGYGGLAPSYQTRTAADGSYTVRGLETAGSEVRGHIVALFRGLNGYPAFIGKDPADGIVPADRARVFGRTTAPIDAGTVTLPVTTLPADQFILGRRLTASCCEAPIGEILQVSGGTLSAFSYAGGKLQPGVPIRSGLGDEQIHAPGNWGKYDYFWSNPDYQAREPRSDLVTVDPNGDLIMYEGDGYGYLRPPTKVGSGWRNHQVVLSADVSGDNRPDLLSVDGNGVLRLHRGSSSGALLGPSSKVSSGWKGHTLYAAGWLDKDAEADLVSVDADGVLWASFGRGDGTFKNRQRVSAGWGKYTIAAGEDIDGVGYADIVAREDSTGRLYLYSGLGNGSFKTRKLIATGW